MSLLSAALTALRRRLARPGRGVLVIQPLPGIGDMVWHLPQLHALAAQSGPLTLLTKPRSLAAELLRADPSVARILPLERRPGRHDGLTGFFRLVRDLRRERFASAWLFHGSSRYALALALAGVPRTVGYGRGLQRLLLTEPVALPPDRLHAHPIVKAQYLLALAGVPATDPEPRLCLDPTAVQQMHTRYRNCPAPWLAFGIGSSEPVKQWGAARFAELAQTLGCAYGGTVFLLGGPAERALGAAIVAAVPPAVVRVVHPELALADTAALLAGCRLFIGNDTGVLNMAAALNVPALGLFGASLPLHHATQLHALEPATGAGMVGITPAQVLTAARPLLEQALAG